MAKVLISYSHDSAEHSVRVLRFADALRRHGIDAELDLYHQRPTQGWQAWFEEQLRPEVSSHVLMICTPTYHDRVKNQLPADEERGVFWEGRIIHNYLYSAKRNERFVPVLFDSTTTEQIPVPIRNDGYYRISQFDLTDPGYEALYRDLTGQPYVRKPHLGSIVPLRPGQPLTTFQPLIASSRLPSAMLLIGRESELAMLDAAWSVDSKKNVLTIVAWGGVGKSTLAAHWAATKINDVERYFDWSFYRQGSSDVFLKTALEFFGDAELAASAADGWQKGERLAQLVAQHRTLLILDGLEPLQDAKTGELRDPALTSLLRGLAARNRGLCVVTTRQEIPDLDPFRSTTAPQWKLAHLSDEAGASLLENLGVRGTSNERETLARDLKGHAFTLTLLAKFLAEAHGGDIRKRDLVSLHEADSEETSGHAFRIMEAYEQSLKRDGRNVELAILRLLSLFDRPATPDCLGALRQAPGIDGLTDWLVTLTDAQWNLAVKRLVQLGFVEEQPWEPRRIAGYSEEEARRMVDEQIVPGDAQAPQIATERRVAGNALDAHPLIREHFARRLREGAPEAWRAAHGRLYEHLRDSVPYWPEGIDGLQPLYQSIVHGCQAGRGAETCRQVYRDRIQRGTSGPYAFYSTNILGSTGADLAAVKCFFTVPWKQVSADLTAADQNWILNVAAFGLRGLGRLDEAREPMRAGLEAEIALGDWKNAAVSGGNLSELDLTVGDVASALRHAEQSVQHADQSGNAYQIVSKRTTHADALHHAGHAAEAGERFREAETLQRKRFPTTPLLYSLPGFRFCDLLLAQIERAAWRRYLVSDEQLFDAQTLADVEHRATTALAIAMRNRGVLDMALDNLTLGRVALLRAILGDGALDSAQMHVEAAVNGLRQVGAMHELPRALLTHAWLRVLLGNSATARGDLDEAQQLAERGPMRLHLADVHLHRARFFFHENPDEAREELEKARVLIERCGYHRRDEELLDAEQWFGWEVLKPSTTEPSSGVFEASEAETAARNALADLRFADAAMQVRRAINADSERAERLRNEFGFVLAAVSEDGRIFHESADAADRLRWCARMWRIIAAGNSFPLADLSTLTPIATAPSLVAPPPATAPIIKAQRGTAERKGEELEAAVERLFRRFFAVGEEVPWKVRRQQRGSQGGFDLSIEWDGKCQTADRGKARCHIECKNQESKITPEQVAEKLFSEPRRHPVIDHWVLISPRANPSNELNKFLEQQRNEETFPFEVQVWCPETGIDGLFGLEPDVYDAFFTPRPGEPHPREWTDDDRAAMQARWAKRLEPRRRLPRGWSEYLTDPALLCIHQEDAAKMNETHASHVPMRCRNIAGALLEKPLDRYVDEWLEEKDHPVLVLLGEFGDGKSFFTYSLARRLITVWKDNPPRRWLPLRLALRKYPPDARDFLRQRLEVFGADVAGWNAIGNVAERLVILDGFDEMSVKLDRPTVTENIEKLLACIDEFAGCKILVTSRKHFFQNQNDAQRLLSRTSRPLLYVLAPISRGEVIRNVALATPDGDRQRLAERFKNMNDPIGMAGKPLFLEMLKDVLADPMLPHDFDVVTLYDRYITRSLQRKPKELWDPKLETDPDETVANLRGILGEIAAELQRTGLGYVSLSDFKSASDRQFAELLWSLSGPDTLQQDARARVGSRSLLGRVDSEPSKEWPVDFCHRSMREYFVAERLCGALRKGPHEAECFLRDVPLNHEVLEFAVQQLKKYGDTGVEETLLSLLRASSVDDRTGVGGRALTLLYRLKRQLPHDFDWRAKNLDGADLEGADLSDLDFSGSSLRSAILANVNFENCDFSGCDLTGVRIEETKPVVALAASPAGDRIVAAYSDGVLRDWTISAGGHVVSEPVGTFPGGVGATIGVHENGQAWLRAGEEWWLLDRREKGPWSTLARFLITDGLASLRPRGTLMAVTQRSGGKERDAITIVDVERSGRIGSYAATASRHCVPLGSNAIVWTEAAVGLHIERLSGASRTLPCKEVSSIDVRRQSAEVYLVAGGTEDGSVYVWEVDTGSEVIAVRDLGIFPKVHLGSVTDIVILDDGRIASGGSDCAIVLTRWFETGAIADDSQRLQLKLRCKGMKIDGLQGIAERRALQAFIEHATA